MDKASLSTLIEIGSRRSGRTTKEYATVEETPKGTHFYSTCAIGAAALAKTGEESVCPNIDCLPSLHNRIIHPVTGDQLTVRMAIISLNDEYNWPREHIAYWLKLNGL